MEIDIRCMCGNCFENRGTPEGPCARCGYDPAADRERYPMALHTGSVLNGKYITGRVLGQGGFGITYLAWDYMLKTRVAVKEFFPEGIAVREAGTAAAERVSPDAGELFRDGMRSFLDEARVLARFQGNLNIVGVREFFEENQTAYFVMDYVEGTSLKAYIVNHGGRISWQEAARVLIPVMDALEAVHLCGILHRDVAADNIYLTKNGQIKLLDFGAAWYASERREGNQSAFLKAGYAPIEQYGDQGIPGPYTDVYALAATFYAAVTGYLPPEADQRRESDTLKPPSAHGISIPRELEAAILKGLSVQPENRFQSVAEFRTAVIQVSAPAPNPPEKVETHVRHDAEPEAPHTGGSGQAGPVQPPEEPVKPKPEVPPSPKPRGPAVKVLIASLASAALIAFAVALVSGRSGGTPAGLPAGAANGGSVQTSAGTNANAGAIPAGGKGSAGAAAQGEVPKVQKVRVYMDDPQAGGYVLESLEKLGIPGEAVEIPAAELSDTVRTAVAADGSPVIAFGSSLRAADMEFDGMTPLQPGNWSETFYIYGLEQGQLLVKTFEALTAEIHVKDETFWYVQSGELCGTYTGYLKNGDCDGWGVMNYEDGRVYAGYWSGGSWNGRGTLVMPNGDRLECDFVDNVACGNGICSWADGRRYEGGYADNERNGQGTIYYPDGTSKSGIWENGRLT